MLPSVGTASGILFGVDQDIFDIIAWQNRIFSVACTLLYKPKNIKLTVVSVYGSPYEEGKEEFISELHSILLETTSPLLVGGNFKLVRY